MVTGPFSSVIGMLPIGEFKNRFFFCLFLFYFLGQRWRKKFWSPVIDNPINDGFGAIISIFFFQVREMRDETKI